MSEFYSFNKLLSHNAVMNIVVGARGVGKTYAFKDLAFNKWLKDGSEWVYIRRVDDELLNKSTLWNDYKPLIDKYEIKTVGFRCYIRPITSKTKQFIPKKELIESSDDQVHKEPASDKWISFGYYIPLSSQQNYKGGSFEKVTTVCFDEFCIENSNRHYLHNEVDLLAGLYDTIARRRSNVRLLLLSNSGALNNPYFTEYDITYSELVNSKNGIIKKRKGKIICEYGQVMNNERDHISAISSENYNNYASGNLFKDYNEVLIDPDKPVGSKKWCSIKCDNGKYLQIYYTTRGIWCKLSNNNKRFEINYYISRKFTDEGALIPAKTLKFFRDAIAKNKIEFNNLQAKFTFIDNLRP